MSCASSPRNSPNGSDVLSQSQMSDHLEKSEEGSQRSNSPNDSDDEWQMSNSPEDEQQMSNSPEDEQQMSNYSPEDTDNVSYISDESYEHEVNKKKIVSKLVWRSIEKEDTELDENGEFCDNLLEALEEVNSHISCEEYGSEEDEEVRNEVCLFLSKTKVVTICCDLIIQHYKTHGTLSCFTSASVKTCLKLIWNMVEGSEVLAKIIANYQDVLETIRSVLEISVKMIKDGSCYGEEDDEEDNDDMTGPKEYLDIVYVLSLYDTCIARLRRLGFLELLKPYLDFEMKSMSLYALFALASIVSEEDAEIISANRKVVSGHLDLLNSSLSSELHRYEGWSRLKLTKVLRMLARNDANQRLLFELGVFEPLVNLAKAGNFAEKRESTGVIWALCFDSYIRKQVVSDEELGVVELLKEMSECGDKKIEDHCKGALWTLREDLQKSSVPEYKEIADGIFNTKTQQSGSTAETITTREENIPTVMISYQWNDQETIKKISSELKQKNYKVWLDIDCMGGSTLGAMAEAVDQANVVLICYSEKYKNSSNCRAEAEYAFAKRKAIVPLKMERSYTPDGWLGMLIGSKLFFEFSNKYPFQKKIKELVKEVECVCKQKKPGEMGTANRKKDESSAKVCHLL